MARTVEQIEQSIKERLKASFELSTSALAEWRMWVHCVAYCIHIFEIALDMFKTEMEADAKKVVAGTLEWYNNKCYDFQMGYILEFDTVTGLLEYKTIDDTAKVIKIASVNLAEDSKLFFRVATKDEDGNIVPLNSNQMLNFKNYVDAIKFVGTKTQVISTDADMVHYEMAVYYNPTTPIENVRADILAALEEFKTAQRFGGIIYRHKMLEAVTGVDSVITAKLIALSRKGTEDAEFIDIDVLAYLYAGYYNYTEDSVLTLISINDL